MLVYVECECFVMQMLYVCVLCASCGSSQCCVLHDLQFVNIVQDVLSGFRVRLCFSRQKLYVGMVVCIYWLHSFLCVRM